MSYLATNLIVRAKSAIRTRAKTENGAAMVEYAFLVALIAIALIVAVSFLGTELRAEYSDIGQSVADAGS
ncbi:MAG: Flp family type IVb pilin [Acidimicrobiia bacterium]